MGNPKLGKPLLPIIYLIALITAIVFLKSNLTIVNSNPSLSKCLKLRDIVLSVYFCIWTGYGNLRLRALQKQLTTFIL